MRRHRTITRVFSKPEFNRKNQILIGVHKTRKGAIQKIKGIGDWRLQSSSISKTKRGYKAFIKFK